ncbi:hypothetical protein H5410_052828 [Solanum commersonii]|uniref:Uncharacterized protein n=1 Tax=Solanum commersonii TaxID=4109 RepID=A0A9J5X1W7_SOLCO|nr:hypothetical protein H5410_052828 [Solanum commersonii]
MLVKALFGLKSGTSGRITCNATTYKVKLVTPKGHFEFNCPHNVNILDRAIEIGIDLSFTCKAGWNHLFKPPVPCLHEPAVREFFYKMELLENGGIATTIKNVETYTKLKQL